MCGLVKSRSERTEITGISRCCPQCRWSNGVDGIAYALRVPHYPGSLKGKYVLYSSSMYSLTSTCLEYRRKDMTGEQGK